MVSVVRAASGDQEEKSVPGPAAKYLGLAPKSRCVGGCVGGPSRSGGIYLLASGIGTLRKQESPGKLVSDAQRERGEVKND